MSVKVHIIGVTDPDKCDLCGEIAELRPYGPNGESVCFRCAMKDEEAAERAFEQRMNYDVVDLDCLFGRGN